MGTEPATCGGHISTPQEAVMKQISLNVDKIQVAIYYEHIMDEYMQLPAYKYSVINGDFSRKGKVHTPHPSSSFTALNQPLLGGGSLFIRYGYSHKIFKAFYEFNPNLVDMYELSGHFDLLLNFGYQSLKRRGVVTYCEFAVDVKDVLFQDYLYLDSKLRWGTSVFRNMGSDYIGSERSSRRVIAYDKSKERLDRKKAVLPYDLLRIEAQLRDKKRFPLQDIAAVDSPFDTFYVIDRTAFESSTLPALLALREQLAYNNGCLQLAFASLSSELKKQARSELSSMQPNWWQPTDIWATLPGSKFINDISMEGCVV